MTLAQWLIQHGHAADESDVNDLVENRSVQINGAPALSQRRRLQPHDQVHVRAPSRFVSRGGDKLDDALTHWQVEVSGRVWLDVGASTGGFTDCLRQRGAAHVFALDVGRGLLDPKLLHDSQVTSLERTHLDDLNKLTLDPRPQACVVDVSFISVERALRAIDSALGPVLTLALYKPQFEVGQRQAEFTGVVRDVDLIIADLQERLPLWLESTQWTAQPALHDCAVAGRKGNIEIWLGFGVEESHSDPWTTLRDRLQARH